MKRYAMLPLLQKTKDCFIYIQVETTEIIFQLFRYEERAYDAVVLRTKSVMGDFKTLEAVGPVLSAYINEARKMPECRVIIGLHSGLFSTTQTVITLRREDPRHIIDEAELENLVSSGLWRIFSGGQQKLARKMDIGEATTVLVGALISQVRVDGHRIVTPVGFPAHTVELTVLYGATSRAIHELLLPLLLSEQQVYCTEIGMSELLRLAKRKDDEDFLLMRVSEAHTYVYQSADEESGYVDTISWGCRSLVGTLMNELMISKWQAVELLRRADAALVSEYVRRRIEALLLQEVSVLLKGISAHADQKEIGAVYVSAPFSLPEALFGEAAARRSGIWVPVIPMPDNSRSEKTESALPLSMKLTASSVSALCANAWMADRSFEQSDVQKIVRRRARWLAGSSAS